MPGSITPGIRCSHKADTNAFRHHVPPGVWVPAGACHRAALRADPSAGTARPAIFALALDNPAISSSNLSNAFGEMAQDQPHCARPGSVLANIPLAAPKKPRLLATFAASNYF